VADEFYDPVLMLVRKIRGTRIGLMPKGGLVEFKLKTISKAGIPEAISKAELYRSLNEPEEAESICRDILAVEPEHQLALRLLGLAITDQFSGEASDRYGEVEKLFQQLMERYERLYYTGLLHERRAKAQMRVGRPPHTLAPLFEEAMRCFAEAEQIRPPGNDDPILRWNRCARLLASHPGFDEEKEPEEFDAYDSSPI
jgi:tetratricopeptide (TPR) repeat protein